MRIVHVVLTPRHSGAEIVVGHLAKQQTKEGHTVAVASLNPTDPAFADALIDWEAAGVELFIPAQCAPSKVRRNLDRVRWLRRAFEAFKPDVVFAHSIIPSGYARLACWPLRAKPRVVTVLHSASEDDYAGTLAQISERVLPKPDGVIAVSERGAANYRRRFNPKFPVEVVPNGIDLDRIRDAAGSRLRVRQELLQDPERERLLLQVGRIAPQKRQVESIRALKILRDRGVPAVLVLAGILEDQAYVDAVRTVIAETDTAEWIRLLGSRKDVPELLAAADVFLMPSQSEAHSIALLEGLASGKPIVASDIEVFRFASTYNSVKIVNTLEKEVFCDAIQRFIYLEAHSRPIEAFALESMSREYSNFAFSLVTSITVTNANETIN